MCFLWYRCVLFQAEHGIRNVERSRWLGNGYKRQTSGSLNGSYTNLGSHRGSFSGRNSGGSTLFIYASGGNGGSAGGACANTSRLQGYVGGTLISVNASNNPAYGKTAFISFAVPAGTSYQITSYPTENTSCGAGVFSVFGYQT